MHGPTELFDTDRYNLRRKVAHADGVICISDFTRSQLMYLSDPEHWPKLTVAHMGVDLRKYPFVTPAQHEGLSVLCVARLVPAKGLEVLVDAIGELCRRGRDVTVVIVGEGPLEGSLSRRAAELGLDERAHFAGAVGQEAMASYYAAADVFCLPSFAEGVPVVLMEAMATGRPVVTTRIAGIGELVEDGVSGVLVAPGNLAQLVAALERLAISPELRANMSVAGRQRVEEQFDAVKCAHQVADMFRDMDRSAGITGAPCP